MPDVRSLAFIFTLVAAASGCATTPMPSSEATPTQTILNPALTRPGPGKVAQTFKRDAGFLSGACAFRLYAGGTPFAELRTGQIITIYLEPGEHIIGADSGFCGAGNAEMQIVVRTDTPRTYRVSVDAGSSIRLQPTAF